MANEGDMVELDLPTPNMDFNTGNSDSGSDHVMDNDNQEGQISTEAEDIAPSSN